MEIKELAKAFEGEPKSEPKEPKEPKELKDLKNLKDKKETKEKPDDIATKKKKALPIITFLVGLAVLIGGVAFLAVKLAQHSAASDAERLVELRTFTKDNDESVIWQFTEIGKGTLTTNNHLNDYDFIWTIENGKLKIETSWLYNLNDEYEYKIDDNKLILNNEITFVPSSN